MESFSVFLLKWIYFRVYQACPYGAIVYVWWIDHTCLSLAHNTKWTCWGHPVDSVCVCAYVWVCNMSLCVKVSVYVPVWRRERVCVFVPLRAWQCPQWCHPERFSSSSAMTKMSNDTHIRSHPHHTYRSSHLCCGIWALWDPAGEEE